MDIDRPLSLADTFVSIFNSECHSSIGVGSLWKLFDQAMPVMVSMTS